MSTNKICEKRLKFYAWVAMAGTIRSCIGICYVANFLGFPLEQPFEAAKTIWQAEPHLKNEAQLTKSIVGRYGLAGFYKGSAANFIRVVAKSFYRYPLVLMFQGVFDKMFPGMEHNSKTLTLVKGLSATCVATVESIIVCPLERVKVFFMTRTEFNGGYTAFFRKNFTESFSVLRKELFRGLGIHVVRQNISWIVWLETDALAKMYIRKKYNINPFAQSIPFMLMLPLVVVNSIVNVLAGKCLLIMVYSDAAGYDQD